MKEFTIGKHKVGGNNPCFVIAEIGINFNGSYETALKLIDAAAKAKCNAVKCQLFRADEMYVKSTGDDKSADGRKKDIYKIVEDAELPHSWIPKLTTYANQKNLEFFSTVCEREGADILQSYNMPAYKIASYEITHIPLLRYVARKQKPVIVSSGDATLLEISEALEVFRQEKNPNILLNHCIGNYPAPLSDLNLNAIKMLRLAFPDIVIGYSDHSADPFTAPGAAVALGAKAIEKHITLDRRAEGPDHIFALEPDELKLMVKTIRETERKMRERKKIVLDERVLGTSEKKPYSAKEIMTRNFGYRCIFAKTDIKKGDLLTEKNMIILRPGNEKRGLHPRYYEILLNGYRATRSIPQNKSITWDDVLAQ